MKTTNVILVVGATVLVGGGAYLFLKNKKKKDLLKLAEVEKLAQAEAGTGTGAGTGAGAGGGTGTSSNADLNLANATILASERKTLLAQANKSCGGITMSQASASSYANCLSSKSLAKKKLVELDKKLATLGYKVDAIGQLVKI